MIVFIDLEHNWLKVNKPDEWEKSMARRLEIKYRLEEISGDHCLIIRYPYVDPEVLRQLNVRAVAISGCYTDFEHFTDESLAGLRAIYQEAAWPTIGFCAGYQLMAEAYGAEIGPIGPLTPGMEDPYKGRYRPGVKQEQGFMPVNIGTVHPIFDGLPQQPIFFQAHYWEIKLVPDGFQAIAESEVTSIQAIAHIELPLFGVQFHAEQYDETHLDGRKVIENFFKIVNRTGMRRRANHGPKKSAAA